MEIIRRNTDYALRLTTVLTRSFEKKEAVSARSLSRQTSVSYPITCKLLQKMQKKNIVKSEMGPKGGYFLARNPESISFLEVIQTVQGDIHVNRCFLGGYKCPLKEKCPLRGKLMGLQDGIVDLLERTKLSELTGQQDDSWEKSK